LNVQQDTISARIAASHLQIGAEVIISRVRAAGVTMTGPIV
jgi:hypothetical protein